MNILLLKLPSTRIAYGNLVPLGFAYIAAQLREDGHKVKLYDFSVLSKKYQKAYFTDTVEDFDTPPAMLDMINETIRKEISSFNPELIGITCNSAERFNVMKAVKMIKEINKDILIVVGGTHVSVTAEQGLKEVKEMDIIVRGEGEKVISELCRKIEKGENWRNINGISFRQNGRIVSNPRTLIENLDEIPFPARDLFDNDLYKYRMPFTEVDNNVTGLITSRGCPGRCRFCTGRVFWQGTFRFRGPKLVVDEMEEVLDKYPKYDGFWVFDDNFYAVKTRAIELCNEIKKRKLDIIWGCSGRADMINDEVAEAMASAGCKMVSIGVESGSESILNSMDKQTNLRIIKKSINTIRKHNIVPRGTFIFGWPGETWFDIFKTLSVMWNFEPATIAHTTNVSLYPETPLTKEYLKDFDWYAPMPKDIFRSENVPRLAVSGDPLRAKLLKAAIKWNNRFYMATHPAYLHKVLKTKQKRKEYEKIMEDGGRFIKDNSRENVINH